ncbi:hypothetical protein KR222_006473, partial [Zaprionus bogoriensis]
YKLYRKYYPTVKMVTKKTKKKKTSKKSNSNFYQDSLLKICVLIALLDLAHALFFVLQATFSLASNFSIYLMLALLGTIFWVLIVLMLLVGLFTRRPVLVKAWLIFSVLGFFADLAFLIWGFVTSITVDWDHLKEYSIICMGIFIELLSIYLVYRYYLIMDPCKKVYQVEKGKKKKKEKILDKKACKGRQ